MARSYAIPLSDMGAYVNRVDNIGLILILRNLYFYPCLIIAGKFVK